jgi:hypothetical protein
MKEKFKKITLIIVSFTAGLTTFIHSQTITTYLKHPSQEVIQSVQKELLKDKERQNIGEQDPAEVIKNSIARKLEDISLPLSGFVVLYGGYVDYSNSDGRIAFPLKHAESKVYVVVTPNIKPKRVYSHTVAHLEYKLPDKKTPVKIYLFERKKDAKLENTFYWHVEEQSKPENKMINSISVILLTNLENIYIPEGDFMTSDNTNLVLPNIYVVGNIKTEHSIFNFMDIEHYFEPIEVNEKKENKKKIKQQIITNE